MFATCRWKRSPWLQVTDSLRGSSSLVWSEQGGRGLSSRLSSDWLRDSRWICRTPCRTESCSCSLTGEQALGHPSPHRWSCDLSTTLTYLQAAAAPPADGAPPPPAPSTGQADGHMTAVHSGPRGESPSAVPTAASGGRRVESEVHCGCWDRKYVREWRKSAASPCASGPGSALRLGVVCCESAGFCPAETAADAPSAPPPTCSLPSAPSTWLEHHPLTHTHTHTHTHTDRINEGSVTEKLLLVSYCVSPWLYLAGGCQLVSSVAGQTPDPPPETSWSPEQTADATKPSGHDDGPIHTHTHTHTFHI